MHWAYLQKVKAAEKVKRKLKRGKAGGSSKDDGINVDDEEAEEEAAEEEADADGGDDGDGGDDDDGDDDDDDASGTALKDFSAVSQPALSVAFFHRPVFLSTTLSITIFIIFR